MIYPPILLSSIHHFLTLRRSIYDSIHSLESLFLNFQQDSENAGMLGYHKRMMGDILQSLSADNICLANHSANGFFPEESYSSSSSSSPNGLVSSTTSSFETSSNTGGLGIRSALVIHHRAHLQDLWTHFDVLEGKETYEEAVCSSENGLDDSC